MSPADTSGGKASRERDTPTGKAPTPQGKNSTEKTGKKAGKGTLRAEDTPGTPTQSHISPSILVYEDKKAPAPREEDARAGEGSALFSYTCILGDI